MLQADRLRNEPHVVEDDYGRNAIPQRLDRDDLLSVHSDLNVPSQPAHTFRQRLDHIGCGSGDGGVNDGDASRITSNLSDGIESHTIIRGIRSWRYHHIPSRTNSPLK